MRALIVGALLLASSVAEGQPLLWGRIVDLDTVNTATLALMKDNVQVQADVLPLLTTCPADRIPVVTDPPIPTPTAGPDIPECIPLGLVDLAERGSTSEYAVSACNTLSECSLSNVVTFRIPFQPTPATLELSVALP